MDGKVDQATGALPKVKWDDSTMKTSYANVCNVASTREEVTLLFGTNQTWHAETKEVKVHLTDRIILSPFAAKRLALLIGNVVAEYEKRFGTLGGPDRLESKHGSGATPRDKRPEPCRRPRLRIGRLKSPRHPQAPWWT